MTPTIETRGGKVLRAISYPPSNATHFGWRRGGPQSSSGDHSFEGFHWWAASRRLSGLVAAIPLLLLAGCLGNDPPPVSTIPTTAAACEALRPGFPISFSAHNDTPETVRQVRAVNARFAAACP